MTDNELLLAIASMTDQKFKSELQPIKKDLQGTKKVFLEHSKKLQKIS